MVLLIWARRSRRQQLPVPRVTACPMPAPPDRSQSCLAAAVNQLMPLKSEQRLALGQPETSAAVAPVCLVMPQAKGQ